MIAVIITYEGPVHRFLYSAMTAFVCLLCFSVHEAMEARVLLGFCVRYFFGGWGGGCLILQGSLA